MDGAELELERRSKFLTGLIEKKKAQEQQEQHTRLNVRVRAADMPLALQNRAFSCARDLLDSMPGKLDSKRLALALKKFSENGEFEAKCCSLVRFGFHRRLLLGQNFLPKDFDSAYGPAWHCIVGTSFGSYVTHSIGGFLYFSIDKVYILLFKTAVEPLDH